MKPKKLIASLLLAALSMFVIRATAQQSEHQQGQSPDNSQSPMSSGGMMSPDMMAQHQKMMTQHQEMGKLIDQVVKSFSALENEKDPSLLKKKLAEHGALLKELHSKFQQNSGMMDMGQMSEHSK